MDGLMKLQYVCIGMYMGDATMPSIDQGNTASERLRKPGGKLFFGFRPGMDVLFHVITTFMRRRLSQFRTIRNDGWC